MKKAVNNAEKEGWILIGELDWKDGECPFEDYQSYEPYFLYVRTFRENGRQKYEYSFAKKFTWPRFTWWFTLDKRYSISTILTHFISSDILYEYSPLRGGRPMRKAETIKLRLVGMNNWLIYDKEYHEKKITIDDLELKFRTDREKKMKEEYQNNQFASKKEKKNFKIIT